MVTKGTLSTVSMVLVAITSLLDAIVSHWFGATADIGSSWSVAGGAFHLLGSLLNFFAYKHLFCRNEEDGSYKFDFGSDGRTEIGREKAILAAGLTGVGFVLKCIHWHLSMS
jgi:hypothetical protein